jgi:glycolate oxidase iron-sulfur subunit
LRDLGKPERVPERCRRLRAVPPIVVAPRARDRCGSGGVYNVQKPENAEAIMREKAAFLDTLPADVSPILATANHVCMMQWYQARRFLWRPFAVRHVIQLLDPGEPTATSAN